jgi:hypothetical protein
VLERAAVVGGRFYLDAVVELSDPDERHLVAAHCLSLVRKELVHPDRSDLPGIEAYRFPQVLLRDCAYQATSKRQRADLHERFARWLQAKMLGGPGEHDELVGYHLEQAYRYRVELGQRDTATVELGRQAASCLIEAADRVRQGDEMGAAQLLKRAIVLLPELDPLRLRAEIDLGWALYSFGRLSDADRILARATERARRAGEEGLRAHARLAHLRVQFSTEPRGLVAVTLDEAGQALADFTRDGDEVGAALACRTEAAAYSAAGQFAAAEKAMEMAVSHAEDSGVPRAAQSLRRELASLASWTPQPVPETIARVTARLEQAGDDRGLRRELLSQLAVLTAMDGDPEAARTHLKDAEEIVWDLRGPHFDPLHSGFVVARVAILADDLPTAERELRRSCRHLSRTGERAHLATRAAALADAPRRRHRRQARRPDRRPRRPGDGSARPRRGALPPEPLGRRGRQRRPGAGALRAQGQRRGGGARHPRRRQAARRRHDRGPHASGGHLTIPNTSRGPVVPGPGRVRRSCSARVASAAPGPRPAAVPHPRAGRPARAGPRGGAAPPPRCP